MRLIFKISFLLISIQLSFTQNSEAELRDIIKTEKDSTLIKAYLDLGKHYFRITGKGDSLTLYGEKALELSQNLNIVSQEIEALMCKGIGYLVEGNFKEAEVDFKQGLIKASNINDIGEKADFHNKLGTLYQNKNSFFLAIDHFLEAAKCSLKIKDYESEANAYYGISLVYTAQREYKKQLEYIVKAVNILENNDIKDDLLKTLIYNYAAEQYMEASKKNEYPKYANLARMYAEKALKIANNNNFDYTKPVSYGVLSEYNFLNKNYSKAIFYSKEVLKNRHLITEALVLNTYCIFGRINKVLNNKKKAIAYIDSLNLLKIKSDPYYGIEISNVSYEIYKHFNNPNLALKALEKKELFVRELNDKERNTTINDLETKYKTELKDAEISNLNQQKKINTLEIENKQAQIKRLIFLLILASLIIIGILFITTKIQLKRTKQKNEALKIAFDKQLALEKELTGVRDNIAQDFHDDLGNRLARISLLSNLVNNEVSEKDDKIKLKVKQITDDSNELYAGTRDFIFSLKSNSDSLMELATYLSDFGEDYFSKTKIRFVLENQIKQDKRLPYYWVKQLVYIFKEAMTNALKYSECDTLILKFEFVNNELIIACIDNGIGLEEVDLKSNNGLSNMKNRALKIGGELLIKSLKEKGTNIQFSGMTT